MLSRAPVPAAWVHQFTEPNGTTGRAVGQILARFNRPLYELAVRELPAATEGRFLEIGFGPGVGLERLLTRYPDGTVAGIDPSSVMHEQAARRNRDGMATGRLELRRGTAAELPWPDGYFDGALALNNLLLWRPMEGSVGEVARVLRPDGTLVVGMHSWAALGQSPPGEGSVPQVEHRIAGCLAGQNFVAVRSSEVRLRIGSGLIVRARRP